MAHVCLVTRCEKPVFVKKSGLCQSHYSSARKNGGVPKEEIRLQTSGLDKKKALENLGWSALEPYPGDKDKKWNVACPKKHHVTIRWGTFGINAESCKECRHPSLADTHPHLLSWWNYEENADLSPSDVTKGMEIKIKWKCPIGHSPYVAIYSMAKKGGPSCGICSGHEVVDGVNDIQSQAKDLLRFWDYEFNNLSPNQVFYRTQKKVNWLCSNNHRFEISAWQLTRNLSRKRSQGSEGCKYCANDAVWKGWNDLKTVAPHLIADYVRGKNQKGADEVCAYESQKYWWQCEKLHKRRQQSPQSRVRRGSGCSTCVRNKTEEGVNDALTANPALEAIWAISENGPLALLAQTPRSSSKSFRWICLERKHTYSATVTNAVKGVSCGVCSNRELLVGFNDLATLEFGDEFDKAKTLESAAEFGWAASELVAESIIQSESRKVWWRCKNDPRHAWPTTPTARVSRKSGCPFCAGNRLDVGRNDLATKFPELKAEWSKLNTVKMNEIPFSYHEKVHWKCLANKGHPDYLAAPHARTGVNTTGCPDCNTGGFETSQPAYLYFIEHLDMNACKIGISNQASRPNRLSMWKIRGWREIAVWEDSYGAVIKDTEKEVLRSFIRGTLALPQALSKEEIGGDGQIETFPRIERIHNAVQVEISKILEEKRVHHQARLDKVKFS
jgi:hypothetical protein